MTVDIDSLGLCTINGKSMLFPLESGVLSAEILDEVFTMSNSLICYETGLKAISEICPCAFFGHHQCLRKR